MRKNNITAGDLLKLLIDKNAEKFICIPECKTGKSWGDRYRIMDLWCMAKSWAHPKTIAYEIKVSRADFLKDDKWREYLGYCSEFYFVAPPKLIDSRELPEESGLIVSSLNGTRLYTKKKAPQRSVVIPENIYRYILMWRASITTEKNLCNNTEFWSQWLKQKDENKSLGHKVSTKLGTLYREQVVKVREENRRLKNDNERLQEVQNVLNKMELPLHSWNIEDKLMHKIQEINTGISGDVLQIIDNAIRAMTAAKSAFNPCPDPKNGA